MAEGKLRVLSVTSEAVPLIKSGGLADVAGALPLALAALGVEMRVMLPAYPGLATKIGPSKVVWATPDLFGGPARLLAGQAGGVDFLLLDAPHLYGRNGGAYLGPDGKDYPDNPERFAALSWAAMEVCRDGLTDGWTPEVMHGHDWQAALTPLYLRRQGVACPSILTIHNIAFQGLAPYEKLAALRLDADDFTSGDLEYWGQISTLKAGIIHADQVTTVSPTYAVELQREEFGMGLHGVINARPGGVLGILNGIDEAVWNPETDPEVRNYSLRTLAPRKGNRKALLKEFGLKETGGPLAIVVSRLTRQKGLDLLPDVLPAFVAGGGMVAVLGSGDRDLEEALAGLATAHPGRIGLRIGYNETLSHLMFAGGDAVVIPSRFEPCGLTQLYGLRYGAVPVVTATGGLADTVIAANPAALAAGVATGIVMHRTDPLALHMAFSQLLALYAQPETFTQIRKAGMRADFGWSRSAAAYADLYHGMRA
jgi:starch synthase